MIRILIWLISGLFATAFIHLILILSASKLAPLSFQEKINQALIEEGVSQSALLKNFTILPAPEIRKKLLYRYDDPFIVSAICNFDTTDTPYRITTSINAPFWALTLYEPNGLVITSITNNVTNSGDLDLVIMGANSSDYINQERLDISSDTIIADVTNNQGFALLRLYIPSTEYRVLAEKQINLSTCEKVILTPEKVQSLDLVPLDDDYVPLPIPKPKTKIEPVNKEHQAIPKIIQLEKPR